MTTIVTSVQPAVGAAGPPLSTRSDGPEESDYLLCYPHGMGVPTTMLRARTSERVVLAVGSTLIGATAVGLTPGPGRSLTALLAIPLLCFCPGYVTTRALLPSVGHRTGGDATAATEGRLAVVALSTAASLCLLILVGFVLGLSPWGLTRLSFAVSVAGLTTVVGALATYRGRAAGPVPSDGPSGGEPVSRSRRETVVAGAGAVGLVVGSATALKLFVAPPDGQRYTEFGLLTETAGGELVAGEYPRTFRAGERRTIVVSIGNEERQQTRYTVVVELHRVDESDRVVDREELTQVGATVAAGERRRERVALEPTMSGADLRLTFMLYRGDAPDRPATASAYRSLHLWVTVRA